MILLIFLHPAFHMHVFKKYFSSFYQFLMGNKLKDYMILNSIRFDLLLIFFSILCLFQSSILTFFFCLFCLYEFTEHWSIILCMFSLVKICDSTCINCVTRFVSSFLYNSLFIYRPGQHRA